MTQLTVSSSCEDDENGNADTVTVIRLVATGKRALSDSYSSCEPIPKKLRVGLSAEKHNDTTSTNSYCSDDQILAKSLTVKYITGSNNSIVMFDIIMIQNL